MPPPSSHSPQLQQALSLIQSNRAGEALAVTTQLLAAQPGLVPALGLHAAALARLSRLPEAIATTRQIISLNPGDPNPKIACAQYLLQANQPADARLLLTDALALAPNSFPALTSLAQAHLALGQLQQAAEAYTRLLPVLPGNLPPPQLATILGNLGNALFELGQTAAALPHLRRAAQLAPDNDSRQLNLARALSATGQLDQAEAILRSSLAKSPTDPPARTLQDLAALLGEQGRIEETIGLQRRLLSLLPPRERAPHHSNLLLSLKYSDEISPGQVAEEHRSFAAHFPPPPPPPPLPPPSPALHSASGGSRLRVAYLSPDFRRHPVASFIEGIFSNHNRGCVEVFAYSVAPREDDVTARLRSLVPHFRSFAAKTPDADVAAAIREDRIDVLIDLAGHTAHNRLGVLALSPAPVQLSYLGYPGSTGLPHIQHFITDELVDPPPARSAPAPLVPTVAEGLYAESLLRLPAPFLAFTPPGPGPDDPALSPLPALGAGHLTFGALGNLAKVTPTTLRLWRSVLDALPSSRLIIRARAAGSQGARGRLLQYLPESRVTILPWSPAADRWGLFSQIDIQLDTYPYHGTTTTCESLWMGVPTLSLVGPDSVPNHPSRVALTLLSAVGLQHLLARTEAAYPQIALELGRDLGALAHLRGTLRERMRVSPLMDAKRLTENLERQLLLLWRKQ